jgi:hypothetical protein
MYLSMASLTVISSLRFFLDGSFRYKAAASSASILVSAVKDLYLLFPFSIPSKIRTFHLPDGWILAVAMFVSLPIDFWRKKA